MAQNNTMMVIEINEPILSKVIAVRGDANSRNIDVQLFNNGVVFDLTGHMVTMSVKTDPRTPMKNPVNEFLKGTILDAENGRCMFPLTTSMLAEVGTLNTSIAVFSGETEVLSTLEFNIYVMPSPRNDEAIEASNEFGALVVLFSEIQNALDDMHAIRENFGEPSEESVEAGTDTFWKALEKSIKGSSDLVAYDIPSKIGEETDGEPYNTVFGKLNRIIKLQLKDGEEIFREDGTFTVPEGVAELTIIACGGGGGAALAMNQEPSGGGGAACVKKTVSVTPGQKIQVTIGKGGLAGQYAGDSNGKAGTATVVGNIVTCPGGQGGKDLKNDPGGAAGGSGGGKGGESKLDSGKGGDGENGLYGVGGKGGLAGRNGQGGGGGSYGNGGDAGSGLNVNGKDGGYGAGGGAATPGGNEQTKAGNGGDGIVIFRWGAGSD